MPEEINPTQPTAEGQPTGGVKTGETETEKTFTQTELNAHIERRLAEERGRLERKYTKERETLEAEWTAKLTARDEEVSRKVDEQLAARLKERELADAKAAVVKEFGLTEKQAAVLAGTSADELKAEATELFGGPKQKPAPTVPTGDDGKKGDASTGARIYRRSELRDTKFFADNRDDILAAQREGRVISD